MKKTIKKILKEQTEVTLRESIHNELTLLKEDKSKLSPKFLIKAFKILDKWMLGEGHDIDEVEEDASVYGWIIDVVEELLGINNRDTIDYIVASFVLNYMTAGDWDLLKEIGVKEAQIKKWDLTKHYGIRGWVTDTVTNAEGYLPSEMRYADWNYGYDWDQYDMEISDTWDEEFDLDEVKG